MPQHSERNTTSVPGIFIMLHTLSLRGPKMGTRRSYRQEDVLRVVCDTNRVAVGSTSLGAEA